MKDGYVVKSESNLKISQEDLADINKLTRRNLNEEEVYVFSVVLCDNDVDRDYEKFTDDSLEKLGKMFVGKTGILDHDPKSENQTARIFRCFVEQVSGKLNSLGEPYKRLVGKAYMPKSEKNKDIILEIDCGIKKEVSVGCSVDKILCSICGKDVKTGACSHIKGKKYSVDGENRLCYYILENPTDAYEWSFVAVPAQREAGVISKNHLKGGEKNMEDVLKSLLSQNSEKVGEKKIDELKKSIEILKEKAKIGELYREELKNEIVKLSNVIQPELDIKIMKGICEKISIDELISLKKAFKTKFLKIMPVKPQFAPEKTEAKKKENIQFKI